MKMLQNRYEGERVFLIGNGPSLDKTPLDRLNSEYSIALNGINDIYSETTWRPSFYVLLLEEFEKNYDTYFINNFRSGVECITLRQHKGKFGDREDIHYVKKKKLKCNPVESGKNFHELSKEEIQSMRLCDLYEFWPNDISKCLYTYHSMYAIIQIAIYMGFKEIYLLGCDLGYSTYDPHMIFNEGLNPHGWKEGKNAYLLESYREDILIKSVINEIIFKILSSPIGELAGQVLDYVNELDDANRFGSHTQLQPEDLTHVNDEITKSHIAAQRIASDQGVDIYNATIGGELEVYPRVSLENVVD
ncbi:motility associated factor glycosyltransferase family protein [Halodesulfurarchaeum formicicum]|nr:hypothetical protein [Halodesulfurarchaeum formicicum]